MKSRNIKNNMGNGLDENQLETVSGGAVWRDPEGNWHAVYANGNVSAGSGTKIGAKIGAWGNGTGTDEITTRELNTLREANGKAPMS